MSPSSVDCVCDMVGGARLGLVGVVLSEPEPEPVPVPGTGSGRAFRKTQFLYNSQLASSINQQVVKQAGKGKEGRKPPIKHSNAMLIAKLLLDPYDNHLLAGPTNDLRLGTHHPGGLADFLADTQGIHPSILQTRPLDLPASPHATREWCRRVIRGICAVQTQRGFRECRREVDQVVAGGDRGPYGWRSFWLCFWCSSSSCCCCCCCCWSVEGKAEEV